MNKNVLQALKFTLFSISAGLIQVASFALFHEVLGWESYWMSYLPSLVLSVLWNFTFNRKYTFKPTDHVALYYLIFTPSTTLLGHVLEGAGWHAWLIEALNMLLNFVTEFLYQKFVVYRENQADGK